MKFKTLRGKIKSHRWLKVLLITVLVCLLLEFFVFNMNAFHLVGGNYSRKTLDISEALVSNFDQSTMTGICGKRSTIEFTDINEPVGTLTVEGYSAAGSTISYRIDMADDTNSSYRNGIAELVAIKGNTKSETIPCNFSGNVHKLRISWDNGEKEAVTISRIEINKPIGMHFSIVRFLTIIASVMAIYGLGSVFLSGRYGDDSNRVKVPAFIITAVLIMIALMMTPGSFSDFKSSTGNQLTKELVDAFEAGQVHLLTPVGDDLLALDNPYDWSERRAEGVKCLWDHLLYDGKYYSYYGIGPVLLLFLPYHLITGYYFPSVWASWLFGCIGILFLTKLYLAVADRWWGKVRSSLVLMGLIMMQLSSGIWFTFNWGNFYEIAQNGGFAAVTAGAYFLFTSDVLGEGKIYKGRLALSSFFLALGVLCRPTLAVYCIVALFFIYAGFRKTKEHRVSYFLAALLPFVVLGTVQMAYNYARFGSVMDFGIQYSLTINDFTKSQYHTHFVFIGLWNYLFALPSFSQEFPFIVPSSVDLFRPNGYYFVATSTAIGLVWKALPLLSYGFAHRAYRSTDNPHKKLYTVLIAVSCIIAPLIIIFSIWESGYGARYCVDFAWQMLMGALIIAFMVWQRASAPVKKHLNTAMIVATVICFALVFAQTETWFMKGNIPDELRNLILSYGRLWEFWR